MENQQSRRIVAALAHRVETGADAQQIADAIVSTWREIDTALSPVLGPQAVALLYQRSICLAAGSRPWLAEICESGQTLVPEALKAAFAQQSTDTAAASGYELLQAFHGMLASLVGLPLTERLLRFVCAPDAPNARVPEPAQRESTSRNLHS
ncbi:MAG: hypothetical protein ACREPV_06040 [Lysobacter sp.]